MRANATPVRGLIGNDAMRMKHPVEYLIQFGVVNRVDVREQVVCNVIVETAENEIRRLAERVHVVRAFDLVHHPRRLNIPACIERRIFNAFHMVRHKESEQ